MNFFKKMERKFGKYAIHNLMYYVVILYAIGLGLSVLNPSFYWTFLSLNVGRILSGEIWRVFTFLICPPSQGGLFFGLLALYLYYSLGTTLERLWGAFRFNVYYFMGVFCHIIAAFVVYFLFGISLPLTTYYLNFSLFFAFAAIFPDMQFYLLVLPIKAKFLALFSGFLFVAEFINGHAATRWEIGLSMANFLIFFFMTRDFKRISPKEVKRKQQFKQSVAQSQKATHHTCAVCGRTERDDPNLEFRFCSKCSGNYEYCQDHLYTHKHVTEDSQES